MIKLHFKIDMIQINIIEYILAGFIYDVRQKSLLHDSRIPMGYQIRSQQALINVFYIFGFFIYSLGVQPT